MNDSGRKPVHRRPRLSCRKRGRRRRCACGARAGSVGWGSVGAYGGRRRGGSPRPHPRSGPGGTRILIRRHSRGAAPVGGRCSAVATAGAGCEDRRRREGRTKQGVKQTLLFMHLSSTEATVATCASLNDYRHGVQAHRRPRSSCRKRGARSSLRLWCPGC
jgi:hypothetical protein